MWKVLGVETILINADAVWVDRLISLSQRRKDAPRFRDLLGQADIRYYFDTIREVHMFRLQLPPEVTLEELEFMKEFIMRLTRRPRSRSSSSMVRHSSLRSSCPLTRRKTPTG